MEVLTSTIGFFGLCAIREIVKIMLNSTNDKDFDKLFYELNLCNKSEEYPALINKSKDKYYMKYTIELPVGLSIEEIKNYEENIASFLECENVIIKKHSNSKKIDIMYMHTKPKVEYNFEKQRRTDLKVPLGVDLYDGSDFILDIFKDSNANMYIAGSPGQGKTNVLNIILAHLANSTTKNEVEFAIHDTKMIDLPLFKRCKNTASYYSGTEGINNFLEEEIKEMNARYKLLNKYGYRNVRDFIEDGYKIPYRVVVVEEISSFSDNEKFLKQLSDLTSLGRSAGIIVIMVTQIPTYEVMPTRIKNNVNISIGLKVRNMVCSEIVMNDAELHKLSGSGHLKITDSINYNREIQAYYISDSCLEKIINKNI